jgi:hypothetical protein
MRTFVQRALAYARIVEAVLGVVFVVVVVLATAPLIAAWLRAIAGAASSIGPLLRVDGAATARSLVLALGRIGLALMPSILLIRSVPWRRRVWLVPLVALLVVVSSTFSLAAGTDPAHWLLLAAVSGITAALTSVRAWRWTALLPFALLWEVVPSHGMLNFAQIGTDDPAYRERLLAECARHDGVRPRNLTADLLMPYHGVNALGDDLVLLTGEGPNDGGMRDHTGGRPAGSWWLRRKDGAFEFELPSRATGNLWRGCVLDGTIWMARANYIVGTKRVPNTEPAREEVYSLGVPSSDMDFGETACDPEHGHVYVTEALAGGMWEVAPQGGAPRRYQIGGIVLLPKRRFDGRLVLASTASLMVFDPEEERVIERVPAALASAGFDVCGVDGSVAMGDLTGRVRIFTLDDAGHYRFAWGISLFAPRRVAFSPDCSRIAVTSADDHHVTLVDTSSHDAVNVFAAGPGLREVAATGSREFSISDVCSLTTYRW